jgi:UDP-N-acetylmuramyl pentapeptide phosphotransferase/UDP-N-acetylglucosamine-1-phosphate transferase
MPCDNCDNHSDVEVVHKLPMRIIGGLMILFGVIEVELFILDFNKHSMLIKFIL